jgi:hypothetical protein
VTTSGESDWKSERFPIDGISGASKPEYGTRIVSEAVARLQVLLR